MPKEKLLNKIQSYALKAAKAKKVQAQIELQELIDEVGKELNLPENEKWIISDDLTKAVKQESPKKS